MADDVEAKREEVDRLRAELREAVADQRKESRSNSDEVVAARLDAEAERLRNAIAAVREGGVAAPPGTEARPSEPEVVLPPDATKEEALEAAKELDIEGRSSMSKDELIEAVEEAQEDN
jgi:hypothetical protein